MPLFEPFTITGPSCAFFAALFLTLLLLLLRLEGFIDVEAAFTWTFLPLHLFFVVCAIFVSQTRSKHASDIHKLLTGRDFSHFRTTAEAEATMAANLSLMTKAMFWWGGLLLLNVKLDMEGEEELDWAWPLGWFMGLTFYYAVVGYWMGIIFWNVQRTPPEDGEQRQPIMREGAGAAGGAGAHCPHCHRGAAVLDNAAGPG